MAIIGTWTDRSTMTAAGGAWGGVTSLTVPISVPTVPDWASVNPISIQGLSALPQFGVLRSSGPTIGTLNVYMPSLAGASAPAFNVEIVQQMLWGPIR